MGTGFLLEELVPEGGVCRVVFPVIQAVCVISDPLRFSQVGTNFGTNFGGR